MVTVHFYLLHVVTNVVEENELIIVIMALQHQGDPRKLNPRGFDDDALAWYSQE